MDKTLHEILDQISNQGLDVKDLIDRAMSQMMGEAAAYLLKPEVEPLTREYLHEMHASMIKFMDALRTEDPAVHSRLVCLCVMHMMTGQLCTTMAITMESFPRIFSKSLAQYLGTKVVNT